VVVVAVKAKSWREREVGANGEGGGEPLRGRKKKHCAREEEEESAGKGKKQRAHEGGRVSVP